MRAWTVLGLALTVVATGARGDVFLTTENLNASLKEMLRQQRRLTPDAEPGQRAEALFNLGVAADALAQLLTDEVIAHGSQEKQLIDLALSRTRKMGVKIAYQREKSRFFYDGQAFRLYLEAAPDGEHAAEAAFWLVETEFYRSDPGDPERMLAAAEHKKEFLARYPAFPLAPDVGVFLAIDYRDLSRHYRSSGEEESWRRFADRAKAQLSRVGEGFPDTEQGRIAAEMLRRFERELAKHEPPS